ncbi:FCD domain-containing protein [Microbacterium sp. H1-D42]|uniref:FadR/GntR family transcriptional regulator n=1 Tax=Microbacterium sp. H1-D42 TaxID=2925844 RepID=UPI001F531E8E|nr:FCD domain-containing protein [Microbacterium sp. H1-D42]UNK70463.1 FCD domain-containing protein [Microbacterium sp. H1-D42]
MSLLTHLAQEGPVGVNDIVAALEQEIIDGRWAVGSKIPSERKLAESVAVSRPVVREALRVLGERGLIVVSPGRGSFVRRLNPAGEGGSADMLVRSSPVSARDLVAARTMLEGEAAALAAERRTEEDLTVMRELLSGFDQVPAARAADIDLAFHESIAVASHNPVLQMMFGSIRNLTHGIMLRSLTDREVRGVGAPLHDVVLEAIEAQDAAAARSAMVEHLGAATKLYGEDLDRPLAEVLRQRATAIPSLAAVLREVSAQIPD